MLAKREISTTSSNMAFLESPPAKKNVPLIPVHGQNDPQLHLLPLLVIIKNVCNAGLYRLFNNVLNAGLIYNGQHFFRHCLCSRQVRRVPQPSS